MKLFGKRLWVCLSIIGLLSLSESGPLEATGAANHPVDLKAKVIDGEVYVKASSLVQALGGSGSYDKASGTYRYESSLSVPEVIAKVSPSVVGIIGKPDDLDVNALNNRYSLAHGTGIVLSSDGKIVTNAHVVKNMHSLIVVTADAKTYPAVVDCIDEASDLALIRIKASGLKPAAFGDSGSVREGDPVVAIGTPVSFSLRGSATSGIISGLNRSVDSPYRLLQTDAAINPGNSGGPLVNMKGEVIGINSMKFVDVSLDNMGFSIPSATVQYVLAQFEKYGKVKRPYLGFDVQESWEAVVGLPSGGLTVSLVVPGSSAGKAGIAKGDVLYDVNHVNVSNTTDINEVLKGFMPGDSVDVMLMSHGDLVHRTVVLQELSESH